MDYRILSTPSTNAECSISPNGTVIPDHFAGRKLSPDEITLSQEGIRTKFAVRLDDVHLDFTAENCGFNAAGSSVNIAVGAIKSGLPAGIVTAIHDDHNGFMLRQALTEKGIGVHSIPRSSYTPISLSVINERGDATGFNFKPSYDLNIPTMLDALNGVSAQCVVATGVRPHELDFVHTLFEQRRVDQEFNVLTPNPTAYDPSLRNKLNALLRVTDILSVNEEEARLLLGKKENPHDALEAISRMGPKVVALTMDKEGAAFAYFRNGTTEIRHQPALPTVVRDTTGAGDAFLLGMLFGLLNGMSHEIAMLLGSFVASRNISVVGSNVGLPDLWEIQEFLQGDCVAV